MKTYICLVFIYLVLQCGSLKTESPKKWIYSFHANTSVGNELLAKAASQWSLSGKLHLVSYEKYKIMQFQNLKTTSYNGPRIHLTKLRELDIPDNVNILTEAFVAFYDRNHNNLESVHFLPDEPVWSMNIKKAIASAYQLNYQINPDSNNLKDNVKEDETSTEENILGKCDLKYKLTPDGAGLKIVKTIDVLKCKLQNTTRTFWQNTKHGQFASKTVRNYIYHNKKTFADNTAPFDKIISTTTMKYSKMHSKKFAQTIKQTLMSGTQSFFCFIKLCVQCKSGFCVFSSEVVFDLKIPYRITLHLEDSSDIFNTPDISKHSVVKTPVFEFDKSETKSNLTGKQLIENWSKYYSDVREFLERNYTEFYSEKTFNMFENLYTTMSSMDLETLDLIRDDNFISESQMYNMYISIVPYIGTDSSTRFIKRLLENEYFADYQAFLVIAAFPFYVKNINEKLLIDMEKYQFANITDNKATYYTYILTFSNLVSRIDDLINKMEPQQELVDIIKRYVDDYYKSFQELIEPNIRVKYLVGMGNMGSTSIDHLISIVKNKTETRHIRSLATYTVKPLIVDRKDIAFRTFWPIVKSQCEPYELRVASLALLLESYLDSVEFYSIFMYMKKISDDPVEQHLYSYFYTRLNCHKFWKQINHLADIFLADLKPPQTTKGLMTGRYYAQYSDVDENFRTSLDTHIVANSVTNFPNVLRVTYSDYINQNDRLSSYTLYVKLEGIKKPKNTFNMSIKELYNILRKYELNPLPDDFHLEFIVYYNEKAVFSWLVTDFYSADKIMFSNMFDDVFMYYMDTDYMKFEHLDQNEFVSDLGTSVVSQLKNENLLSSHGDISNLIPSEQGNQTEDYFALKVKYMAIEKTDLRSMNPITNINHGVSSIYSLQRYLKFKVYYNLTDDFMLRWNDQDSLLEHVVDFKDAVYINAHDNTEKYCSNCSSVYFPTVSVDESGIDLSLFKMKTINCTVSNAPSNDIFDKSHIVNSGSPLLNPLVSLLYARDYFHYVALYDTCSGIFYLVTNKEELKEYSVHFKNFPTNIWSTWNVSILYKYNMSDKKLGNVWDFQFIKEKDNEKDVLKIVVDNQNKLIHIDMDFWFVIHSQLPAYDMFSLSTPTPMSSNADILVYHNKTLEYKLEVQALYEVSEKKKNLVNNSEDYAKCLADSLGMIKHNAPTKACFDVSNDLSIYDDYTFNMVLYQRFNIIKAIASQIVSVLFSGLLSKDTEEDLSSTDKCVIKYSASNGILEVHFEDNQTNKYTVPTLYRPKLQPKNKFIQDMFYNTYGIDSVCIITPYNVKTFLESNVPYEGMFAKSMVSFIQCSNNTRIGLVTTVEDYQIGFRFWFDDHIIVLNTNKTLTVNGKPVKQEQKNDLYKLKFYDDSFVILTNVLELYYNVDYVSVKIKSRLIPDVCGTCSSDEVIASNIPETIYL